MILDGQTSDNPRFSSFLTSSTMLSPLRQPSLKQKFFGIFRKTMRRGPASSGSPATSAMARCSVGNAAGACSKSLSPWIRSSRSAPRWRPSPMPDLTSPARRRFPSVGSLGTWGAGRQCGPSTFRDRTGLRSPAERCLATTARLQFQGRLLDEPCVHRLSWAHGD